VAAAVSQTRNRIPLLSRPHEDAHRHKSTSTGCRSSGGNLASKIDIGNHPLALIRARA
jgi:hypothetical protein